MSDGQQWQFYPPGCGIDCGSAELLAAAKKVNAPSIQTEAHKELRRDLQRLPSMRHNASS